MGLFDGLRQSVTPTFSPQQAVMTIVIAAVLSDGTVADEEVARIRAMCLLSPLFSTNSGQQDANLISFAVNVNHSMGSQAISSAAHALSPELRETSFALACDMVLADGIIGPEEETFLTGLTSSLGISENTGRSLIWATLVRNRSL